MLRLHQRSKHTPLASQRPCCNNADSHCISSCCAAQGGILMRHQIVDQDPCTTRRAYLSLHFIGLNKFTWRTFIFSFLVLPMVAIGMTEVPCVILHKAFSTKPVNTHQLLILVAPSVSLSTGNILGQDADAVKGTPEVEH